MATSATGERPDLVKEYLGEPTALFPYPPTSSLTEPGHRACPV